MKETRFKPDPKQPFGLHDCHINGIDVSDGNITLYSAFSTASMISSAVFVPFSLKYPDTTRMDLPMLTSVTQSGLRFFSVVFTFFSIIAAPFSRHFPQYLCGMIGGVFIVRLIPVFSKSFMGKA